MRNKSGFGSSLEQRRGLDLTNGGNFGGYGLLGWPAYPYLDGYGYSTYQTQPNVVLATPYPEVPAFTPPPPPVRSQMHEYHWPSSGDDPKAALSIVSTDGSVHHAIAVWVQDSMVCFVTPDGGGGHLPLSNVNRELTNQANKQQNLNLPLPPG